MTIPLAFPIRRSRVLLLLTSFAAGVLLVGCATPLDGGATPFSIHPPVSVNVAAANTPCPPTWTCRTFGDWSAQISEEPINTAKDESPVEIHWVVIAGGWTFDQNKGIDFRNNAIWNPKKVSATEWKASNRKDNNVYKYTINLQGPSGASIRWDPTVMN